MSSLRRARRLGGFFTILFAISLFVGQLNLAWAAQGGNPGNGNGNAQEATADSGGAEAPSADDKCDKKDNDNKGQNKKCDEEAAASDSTSGSGENGNGGGNGGGNDTTDTSGDSGNNGNGNGGGNGGGNDTTDTSGDSGNNGNGNGNGGGNGGGNDTGDTTDSDPGNGNGNGGENDNPSGDETTDESSPDESSGDPTEAADPSDAAGSETTPTDDTTTSEPIGTISQRSVQELASVGGEGSPSDGGIQPEPFDGNPSCGDFNSSWSELKIEGSGGVSEGTYSDGTLEVTISGVGGGYFDWSSNIGVDAVFAKGGDGGLLYSYSPPATQDGGLHPPINPNTGEPYGISHVSFCYGPPPPPEPGIDVVKTCPPQAEVGEEITYTIVVTNTGNETLEGITVNDTLLGGLSGDYPDSLGVGESVSRDFKYTVDSQDVHNEVTASGTGADSGETVSDQDACDTEITHKPGIDVTKSCPAEATSGEEITYTIEVTNTGDEALNDVTVVDTVLGDLSNDYPDSLGVGESVSRDFNYTVGSSDVHNEVTASGTGADSGETVSDQDACDTRVLNAGIHLEKDGPATVHRGDTIAYTFVVTNAADAPLHDVSVTDPRCDADPVLVLKGDGDQDDLLESGEAWVYGCEHVVTQDDPDPIPNTAEACGLDPLDRELCDEASHEVDIIDPAIDLVKTVDPTSGHSGDSVTYTFKVTNTGDTRLFNVSVDDDVMGHIGDIPTLDPGESSTLTRDFQLGDASVHNVAAACGRDMLEKEVCDTDDADVTVVSGEEPPPPPEEPPTVLPDTQRNPQVAGGTLPFTGGQTMFLMIEIAALTALGVALLWLGRRRPEETEG